LDLHKSRLENLKCHIVASLSLSFSARIESHNFVSQHHNSEYRVEALCFVFVHLFNLRMCHWNSGTVFANEALCTKVYVVCSVFCPYYIRWKTQQKDGNSAAPLPVIKLSCIQFDFCCCSFPLCCKCPVDISTVPKIRYAGWIKLLLCPNI